MRYEARPIGLFWGVYDTVRRDWMRGGFGNVLELDSYAAEYWVNLKNKEAAKC